MSSTTQDILVLILLFGIATLGLDLITGYARIFSVNQALLFGIGAFGFAVAVNHLHTDSLLVAWAIAVPVAAALSTVIALVSLRVSGDYFLVVSFGAQLVCLQVLYNWTSVSGGPAGIFGLPYPTIFGWMPVTIADYLGLAAVVCGLAYGLVAVLMRSPYGRLVRALGQDEAALAAAGYSALRVKVTTFVLGGCLAATAGALYAGYLGVAQVGDYSLDISISLLAMVIVGGAGRIVGGLLGASILVLVPRLLDNLGVSSSVSGPANQAIFGALLLAIVVFLPSGLTGAFRRPSWARLRRGRPADHVDVRATTDGR